MVDVNWGYAGDALPAAVTLLFIPFSYSVAYGLIAYEAPVRIRYNLAANGDRGMLTYVVLNGFTMLVKAVTRGKIVPADYDQREYWTCK